MQDLPPISAPLNLPLELKRSQNLTHWPKIRKNKFDKKIILIYISYKISMIKGQTKSKRFFPANDSFKQRKNEYYFTTMKLVLVPYFGGNWRHQKVSATSCKKRPRKWWHGIFFGPSYFVTALVHTKCVFDVILMRQVSF